jgi:hypothetical protein
MLHKDNLLVVTTTLQNNKTSEKRRKLLDKNFKKYRIKIIFNEGIKKKWKIQDLFFKDKKSIPKIMYQILLNRFVSFKNSSYQFGLICDDDFYPIDNFMEELNKTIDVLPPDWEMLHLCPGFLWGRKFRDMAKVGSLNPESKDIKQLQYHTSGRYYKNCTPSTYCSLKLWLGGPIALVVNRHSIDGIIERYQNYRNLLRNNDVILTKMLNERTFICRQPQLGYEEESGGSTFK